MEIAWFDHQKHEQLDYNTFEYSLNDETLEKIDSNPDVLSVFASSDVTANVMEKLDPEIIVTRSTGFDHIDLEKAEELGIKVYNVPHYGSNTVAEHAFTLLLGGARNIIKASKKTESEFNSNGLEGFELKNKKIGIIGTGEIGQKAIKTAKGLEMEVIAYDPYEKEGLEEELEFMYVNLEDLIQKSDVISLHCPLTSENHHLLSHDEFEKMEGTTIINTARGGLIDSQALLEALEHGKVDFAGLDVLEVENELQKRSDFTDRVEFCSKEFEANCKLIERDDTIVTPHSAFNTEEAKQRIFDTTITNIEERPEENRVV